jgi:drug/metabolite transporter (DMT)-like permease
LPGIAQEAGNRLHLSPPIVKDRQCNKAILFLILGTFSFGFSGVLIKLCRYPPAVIASFRMILAGLVLTPFCIGSLRSLVREKGFTGLLVLLIPGVLLGLHLQAWVLGLKRTYVASATFIFSINPVFFALLERLLYRRRISTFTYLSLFLVLAGAYWLFVLGDGRLGRTGDLLCLLATLLFVAYLLASRAVAGDVPHLTFIHLIYLWGGVVTLPFVLAAGQLARLDLTDAGSILALAGLALFPTLVGHTSSNYGVRHLAALTVSFFTLTEPVIATAAAALILNELPGVAEFPAYGLFIAATLLYLITSRAEL